MNRKPRGVQLLLIMLLLFGTIVPVIGTTPSLPQTHLFLWVDNAWQWVGMSLRTYGSAEECKRHHWWGVKFRPADVWEDGTPIEEPVEEKRAPRPAGKQVYLDGANLNAQGGTVPPRGPWRRCLPYELAQDLRHPPWRRRARRRTHRRPQGARG
jgi:hypothetical protein